MPTAEEITTFDAEEAPAGESPWVPGKGPRAEVRVVDPDPAWPAAYERLAARIRGALGWRVLSLEHVGSTSVPGLPAKPVVDIDLIVADAADEAAYLPALEATGFDLRVRAPWNHEHRALSHADPDCNLHVFGPDAPEPVRHRLFRDWLRGNPDERALYARAKLEASAASAAAGEHVMQYNARKERVLREIYGRAFRAAGLLTE